MDKRRRGRSWGTDETRLLVQLWSEPEMLAMFHSLKRKRRFYTKMEERMLEWDYSRTAAQIKEKIHALKKKYRECIRNISKMGLGDFDAEEFTYFDDLDRILSQTPVVDSIEVLDSIVDYEENVKEEAPSHIQTDSEGEVNYSPVPSPEIAVSPPKKRKKPENVDGTKSTLDSLIKDCNERDAELVEYQKQMLNFLKERAEKEEQWRQKQEEWHRKQEERQIREDARKDKVLELMEMVVKRFCKED